MPHISSAIALLVGRSGMSEPTTFILAKGLHQMIESVGTLGRARSGQTSAIRCLHHEYLWVVIRPREFVFGIRSIPAASRSTREPLRLTPCDTFSHGIPRILFETLKMLQGTRPGLILTKKIESFTFLVFDTFANEIRPISA